MAGGDPDTSARKRTPSPNELGKLGDQMNGLKLNVPPTFTKLNRKLHPHNHSKDQQSDAKKG